MAKKVVKKVKVVEELKNVETVQKVDLVQANETKSIEQNNSGAPKNFVIKCSKCCWSRLSSGLSADLVDIHEIKSGCKTCGKWRKFHCPKCGSPATMKRIKGNS